MLRDNDETSRSWKAPAIVSISEIFDAVVALIMSCRSSVGHVLNAAKVLFARINTHTLSGRYTSNAETT